VTSTGESPVSLVGRTWRRLIRRTVRIFYVQGDTRAQVSKRTAVFVVGWGCFIGLLTWAGYNNGVLHGTGDGILTFSILFALALLTAPRLSGFSERVSSRVANTRRYIGVGVAVRPRLRAPLDGAAGEHLL
jgi:hypothetical protein